MTEKIARIGIVGASSLIGKEVAEALSDSAFGAAHFVLLDEDDLAGTVTSTGDEAAFIEKLDASSFEAMDFVFFTGSKDVTQRNFPVAKKAGASIIDLTYGLAAGKDAKIRAPWIAEALGVPESAPNLAISSVIAAHPAAVMLALVAAGLKSMGLKSMAATVFEPASEHGRPAMDELQQQTVSLLSFQPLPREHYDAQVTFNLVSQLGESSKINLGEIKQAISNQYKLVGGDQLAPLTLQLIQAPVFHGYTASLLVDLNDPMSIAQVEAALESLHSEVIKEGSEPPSNLGVAGQEKVMIHVTPGDDVGLRFWLWLAADNLKLHAMNAVACASAMKSLPPMGKGR